MSKRYDEKHGKIINKLELKKEIALMKREERRLKLEILRMRFPFHFKPKFNKVIVSVSVIAIILYTVAAILLQRYTMMELSPTLTTCVYAFFGTELLGLAGIKIYDTKYPQATDNILDNTADGNSDMSG